MSKACYRPEAAARYLRRNGLALGVPKWQHYPSINIGVALLLVVGILLLIGTIALSALAHRYAYVLPYTSLVASILFVSPLVYLAFFPLEINGPAAIAIGIITTPAVVMFVLGVALLLGLRKSTDSVKDHAAIVVVLYPVAVYAISQAV